jgi:hypothetical protein
LLNKNQNSIVKLRLFKLITSADKRLLKDASKEIAELTYAIVYVGEEIPLVE